MEKTGKKKPVFMEKTEKKKPTVYVFFQLEKNIKKDLTSTMIFSIIFAGMRATMITKKDKRQIRYLKKYIKKQKAGLRKLDEKEKRGKYGREKT